MLKRGWLRGFVLALPVVWLAAGCGGGAEAPKDAADTTAPAVETGEPAQPAGQAAKDKTAETPAEPQPAVAEGWGSVKGRIVYVGTPPEQPVIEVPSNVEFCRDHKIVDESLIVNSENNGLKNVFVYMRRAPSAIAPELAQAPADSAIIDQERCAFKPHAQVIRVEQGLKVLSNDPTRHNTRTFSQRNPTFNEILVPNEREGREIPISRTEFQPFQVKCDIHAWMSAWVLPLDHPYGVVTDENGNFEIAQLPAGTQSLIIWHERKPNDYINRDLQVTIKAGETVDLGEIEVPAESL
jgi:hypothetical protein